MAQEELEALTKQLEQQEAALHLLMLPKDADDDRDVVMEIRAGAGGEEAALFGASLLRMYSRYAERKGFSVSLMSLSETELGGVKEAVFTIEGRGAFSRLKYESGVHRIQRVPATESQGRIHTSTATVAVLPVLRMWKFTSTRVICALTSSAPPARRPAREHHRLRRAHHPPAHGPGGLLPERAQPDQNREQAMKVLKIRLYEQAREAQEAQHADNRRSQVGTGDHSERIRTYNFPRAG